MDIKRNVGWIVVVSLLLGCGLPTATVTPETATVTPVVGMPNPASVFCQENGGRLEIRTAADGSQAGYCIFPDGSECEEWAYFRGECAPGTAPDTAELIALVQSRFPPDAFGGIAVLPLTVPPRSAPLWAVYSYGMRNWSLTPPPSMFFALYTYDGTWRELSYLDLESAGPEAVSPDYLDQTGVAQVQISPDRIWIEAHGGVGAHGGTYHLLSFDGAALTVALSATGASPGVGELADVNGDGVLDVIIDASDYYVFCYACGVRLVQYKVYYWDAPDAQMMEVTLQPFLMGQPQPMRDLVNPAVAAAEAGLWQEALDLITQAEALLPSYPEADGWTLAWDAGLIRLHAQARAQEAASSPYPLLSNVFYGDYAAAVNLMRPYAPAQIFSASSPLIVGTPAESWESALSRYILDSANAALAIHPELAPAYFLRGWARYLANPTDPQAGADIDQAAALAPSDAFFAQCAAYLP